MVLWGGGGILVVAAVMAIVGSFLAADVPCGCFGGFADVGSSGRRILASVAGLGALIVWADGARASSRDCASPKVNRRSPVDTNPTGCDACRHLAVF